MFFKYTLLLLTFLVAPALTVDFHTDPGGKYECTCNSVSSGVCMSQTCLVYGVKAKCFAGSSQVSLQNGSMKSLANVQIGDQVLVGDGTYEPVLDFLHLKRKGLVEYLRVSTQNSSKALLISADHLIFLFEKGDDAVFAGKLRVGDHLKRIMSDGQIVPDEITDIELVTSEGFYAPLTSSGTIVVDGLVASNYAVVSNHRLAHQMMGIYRWWIRIFGAAINEEHNEQEDVHWLMQTMEKFARHSVVKNLTGNEFFEGTVQLSAIF